MRISFEFELEITDNLSQLRLDKALSLHPRIESRSQATRLVDWGLVSIAGETVKPSRITSTGEIYLVRFPEKETREIKPFDFKLDVVFEDEDLLVIDKPHGLVVHPAAGHYDDTLVNALLHHTNQLSSGFEADRPGLVHRLDKDTSGLLVVAKNDSAQRFLAHQFKEKTAHRIYLALVYGTFRETSGTFRSYLHRHPTNRLKFVSDKTKPGEEPQGKLAITHYRVLKEDSAGLSLLELKLETGRTHQIRVHLSEAGHPIVGDPIYGNLNRHKEIRSAELRGKLQKNSRLMLHAAELGFVHPRTKEILKFKSSGEHFNFRPLDFFEELK